MTETPCVVVNVQRGGPSTGLPTMTAQANMMQARWGSHGDYEMIALAPSSAQEIFFLTITAFDLSEIYRTPVFIMTDEVMDNRQDIIRLEQNGLEDAEIVLISYGISARTSRAAMVQARAKGKKWAYCD